jgi:hypothetical protein
MEIISKTFYKGAATFQTQFTIQLVLSHKRFLKKVNLMAIGAFKANFS